MGDPTIMMARVVLEQRTHAEWTCLETGVLAIAKSRRPVIKYLDVRFRA